MRLTKIQTRETRFTTLFLYNTHTQQLFEIQTYSKLYRLGEQYYTYNFFFNLARLLSLLLLNNIDNSKKPNHWLFFVTPKKRLDLSVSTSHVIHVPSFSSIKTYLVKTIAKHNSINKYLSISNKIKIYKQKLSFIQSFRSSQHSDLFRHNSISQNKSPINRRIKYLKKKQPKYFRQNFLLFIDSITNNFSNYFLDLYLTYLLDEGYNELSDGDLSEILC